MEFEFKYYSSKYFNSLVDLLDECFSIKNKDKVGLVHWKYFDDFFKDRSISAVALREKNVIGFYSNIPIPICLGENKYKSLLCTDMCTMPSFRGQGIISNLYKMVYEKVNEANYDFSIGFSNDAGVKVDKHSSGYGYIVLGRFVRYFKLSIRKKDTDYILCPIKEFKNLDINFNSKFIKVCKNYDYLNWRYLKKPNPESSIYEVQRKNKFVGYVILRFLKKKCYVYDIISEKDDKESYCQILNAIENESRNKGSKIIIYNVLDNSFWNDVFSKFKYIKKVNNKFNYFFTIKIHNNELEVKELFNKNNWLLMNGDIL